MSPAMIKEFRLPDLGEGLTESEILSWKVAVGDTVELNQVIAEVETAKAVVELPSPFAGTVAALHEQPGSVVEVGKPIVSFEVDDAGAAPSGNGGTAGDAAAEPPHRNGRRPWWGMVPPSKRAGTPSAASAPSRPPPLLSQCPRKPTGPGQSSRPKRRRFLPRVPPSCRPNGRVRRRRCGNWHGTSEST